MGEGDRIGVRSCGEQSGESLTSAVQPRSRSDRPQAEHPPRLGRRQLIPRHQQDQITVNRPHPTQGAQDTDELGATISLGLR